LIGLGVSDIVEDQIFLDDFDEGGVVVEIDEEVGIDEAVGGST
jgi:hypothetical protein